MTTAELRKQLKKEYPGDFCLFLENVFGTVQAWVYTHYDDAKKHYARITNSLIGDMTKPTIIFFRL